MSKKEAFLVSFARSHDRTPSSVASAENATTHKHSTLEILEHLPSDPPHPFSLCDLSEMTGSRGTNLLTRLRSSSRPAASAVETTNAAGTKSSATTSQGFSPHLIFSQIVALQSLHYLFLSVILQINHVVFGTTITVDRIFTARYLNLWSRVGWSDNLAVLISHIIGAYLLLFIVEKSRKCLDFATTLFFIHFLFSCLYGGFPASWDWWIIHVLGTIVMTLLGEYLCSRRELEDIPLL